MEERVTPSLLRSAAIGTGAGIGATAAMSLLMVAADRIGLMGEHPPSKLGGRLLDRLTWFHSSEEKDALGTGIHYAIGAGLGAIFALLRRLVPPMRLPGAGIVYAIGVWLVSYGGVLPALRLMPRPDRDRPGRQPVMVAGHVLFGLVLGLLTRGIRRARRIGAEDA